MLNQDAMTAAQRRVDVGEAEADQVPWSAGRFLGFGVGFPWDQAISGNLGW